MIVEGAIHYFAEHGFDGETRALARSIGVSQALIFHYFPTKEALIDRERDDDQSGFVASRALTAQKARILLALLLASGITDPAAVQAEFDRR